MRRVTFVVSDTVGHVMPALAVAKTWWRRDPSLEALFIGPDATHEALVRREGWSFAVVPASALMRVGPFGRARAVWQALRGIPTARARLVAHGSHLVIGTGGYATGAVLIAARILGAATALIEPNVRPGLANRLLRRVAHRVYLSVPEAAEGFASHQCLVTGTPVRPALAARLLTIVREAPAVAPRRILVTGATRGGGFLATAIPPLMAELQRRGVKVDVRHQAGTEPPDVISGSYARSGVRASVVPFIDDMAEAYAWADLVVARAGASTLAELALAALPSLLVPLGDAAADHQADNARRDAASGAALWTTERDWNAPAVADWLATLLLDPQRWIAMSRAARAQARPGAADAIVDDALGLQP